jgi:hypothetical protein
VKTVVGATDGADGSKGVGDATLFGFVLHGRPERSQHRSGRHVGSVELTARRRHQPNSYAPIAALDDERVALQPEPVRQAGQQRRDRREDPPAGQIRARVTDERTPVDQHGYRSSRWE